MYRHPIYLDAMPSLEPSAADLFREEWYEKAEKPAKHENHPSMERGLAGWLRAYTMLQAGRFVPLI